MRTWHNRCESSSRSYKRVPLNYSVCCGFYISSWEAELRWPSPLQNHFSRKSRNDSDSSPLALRSGSQHCPRKHAPPALSKLWSSLVATALLRKIVMKSSTQSIPNLLLLLQKRNKETNDPPFIMLATLKFLSGNKPRWTSRISTSTTSSKRLSPKQGVRPCVVVAVDQSDDTSFTSNWSVNNNDTQCSSSRTIRQQMNHDRSLKLLEHLDQQEEIQQIFQGRRLSVTIVWTKYSLVSNLSPNC